MPAGDSGVSQTVHHFFDPPILFGLPMPASLAHASHQLVQHLEISVRQYSCVPPPHGYRSSTPSSSRRKIWSGTPFTKAKGAEVKAEDLLVFLAEKFAKWQLPDAFIFASEIPRTSVGKFLKTKLREEYANWEWK